MPSSRLLSMLLLLLFTCGCAGTIPEPISYTYSQQQKMQAAQHWEVLAADLANRINNQLVITDNIDKAVFVKETCGNDAVPCGPGETGSFDEAFRDLLITYLVDFGIPTQNATSTEALDINYKVQVVRHDADRRRSLEPGLLTAISAAVVVLRDAPANLVTIAAGAAADIANTSLVTNGHYEVIITTSIVKKRKYLFRSSDIYYINDKDFWHYQTQMPQTKTIKLSSGGKRQAKPAAASANQAAPSHPAAPVNPEPVTPVEPVDPIDHKAVPETSIIEPAPLQLPFDKPKDA